MKKFWTGALAALTLTAFVPAFAAPATFQQAAADYKSGKYSLALSEFQALNGLYPGNMQLHYYMALSYQALGRLDKANAEYSLVANGNSGSLKPMAVVALSQLSKAHGGGGGSSASSSGGNAGSGPGSPGNGVANGTRIASAAASTTPGEYKTRKVIEFYADW